MPHTSASSASAAPRPLPPTPEPRPPASRKPAGPRLSRQLTLTALLLVFVPGVLELLALGARAAPELAAPASLLPPLVLSACLPYLTLALCCAALAWLWSGRDSALGARVGWNSLLLLVALLVGLSAARARPSLEAMLLGGAPHRIEGTRLLLGEGGPLAPSLPVQPAPIGAVEGFAVTETQGTPGTFTTVGWYAHRFAGREEPGRVELAGAGQLLDVTDRLRELRPGETRFLTHQLAPLPPGSRLELRPAGPPLAPTRFFDPEFRPALAGFALESGGGNSASVVDTRAEGGRGASLLVIRGTQQAGGYSVAILAGARWEPKNLGELVQTQGSLELVLEGDAVPPFLLKLTGQGGESAELALWDFAREPLGNGLWRYRLPLARVDWKGVSRESVVGLALVHVGAPGPFELRLERAAAVPSEDRTGVGILAVSSPTPGARPGKALLAAGEPVEAVSLLSSQLPRRLLGGLLLLLGAIGWAGLRNSFRLRPLASVLALLCGPLCLFGVQWLLSRFESLRPEYGGLALGAVALAVATAAALRDTGSEPSAQEAQEGAKGVSFTSMDALKTVAMVGIIGIHVTVDPAGGPYDAYGPGERLWPLLLRGVLRPFDIAIFITSSFFLLAHSLERSSRPYGEQVRHRLKRLLVPFLFWSLFYLAFRFAKAEAFGYSAHHLTEITQPSSWARYAVLGSAQYHLHFLPFLASLTLLYPLARPLATRPAVALLALIGGLLGWYFLDGLLYSVPMDPGLRDFLQRGTKTFGYLGFVVLGFAMYRVVRGEALEGRRWAWCIAGLAALGACAVPLFQHVLTEAELGQWVPPTRVQHMGRHLLMGASFVLFALSDKVRWPAWLVGLGGLTFGVFLVHPAILDVLEIVERGVTWAPLTRTLVNFGVTTVLSFAAVSLLTRVPWLRWTIGLERGKA